MKGSILPAYRRFAAQVLVASLIVVPATLAARVNASPAASSARQWNNRTHEQHPTVAIQARWQAVSLGPGQIETVAMACPTTRVCFVTGLIEVSNPTPPVRAVASPRFHTTIFHTTNGGRTWQTKTVTSNEAALYSISCPSVSVCFTVATSYNKPVDPRAEHTSIIATHDAGRTWQTELSANITNAAATRCTTGRAGCILVEAVACPSVAVCYAPAAPIPYSSSGRVLPVAQPLLTTRDSGRTWRTVMEKPFGEGPPSCPTVVTCYAFGLVDSVTTDGGTTWSRQPSRPSSIVRAAACPRVRICYVVGSGLNGGRRLTLADTKDGGRTWGRRYTPPDLYGIACPAVSICYTVGADTSRTQAGIILTTRDGGRGWHHEAVPNAGGPHTLIAVACPRVNVCFAAVHEGSILIRSGG